MEPTMALKPLAFALTAVMAMAAQAGGNSNGNGHCNHQGASQDQLPPSTAGAGATVLDEQDNDGRVMIDQEDGGWDHRGGYGGGHYAGRISDTGTFELVGNNTPQVLTLDGWKNAILNRAAVNNVSGNGEANVSTGVDDQPSHSMAIAASCKACM
ncbi:hypothetical protein J3P95_12050 [Pseudomonas sp. Z5-35]|uniref:hypothetical protein n=1 Tax=unclassified Pseudomonas TaxID=196821 RepID=UPI003DAA1DF9